MGDYSGFSALGSVLGGGKAHSQDAYMEALKQGYTTDNAWQESRKNRALAMIAAIRADNQAKITPELLGGVMSDPHQAALAATLLGSSDNPDMRHLGDYQRPDYVPQAHAAAEALKLGDVTTYNRMALGAAGKPIEQTKIAGGVAFDPLASSDQPLHSTPLGEAQIGTQGALASKHLSDARANTTKAGAYADHQGREPYVKPGMNADQANAKMNFILQQANRYAPTHGDAWAQAWMQNEAAKAGIVMPFEMGTNGKTGQPVDATALGSHPAAPHVTGHPNIPAVNRVPGAAARLPGASASVLPVHVRDVHPHPSVPRAAVVAVRANPALRQQFAAKYGEAAVRDLGL